MRTRRRLRFGAGAAVAIGLAAAWLRLGPLPAGLLDLTSSVSTVVVDRHGERLYEARSAQGLRGDWLDAAAVPERLVRATMAAEDVRFQGHVGIDPIAVVRAGWRNIRYGEITQGGSTITQQVVELLLARQHDGVAPRGWRAKAWEAVIALRLEHRLTKDDILALYVNLAPYGNQIQGAARASRAYFGRDVSTLTTAETAFLAALPQQPSRFNPWRFPERARPRQRHILSVMTARGWIGAEEAAAARQETLRFGRDTSPMLAPHFVERVLAASGPGRPRRVETTLDAGLQRTVHGIIAAERPTLERHQAANVAVAILDNRTGEWLAWEGSGDYLDAEHGGTIDGVVSPRQPGSALKPFTYAAAFERGWHPGRVLADVPSQFPTAKAGVLYSPRNYDGRFRGPLLARAALAGSENVPAVALASEIGVPAIARLLRQAGITTLENNAAHYGLGLTLGNAEVRLDELVAGYAMFARGGERVTPRMIRAIDGSTPPPTAIERIVSSRTAFWVTDVLSDNEAREYVFGRGGSLEFPFPVAAKTGTSQSYFDNWAIGYTREVTVGVWVGNFDRRPLRGSSGVTGAGPVFHAVMLAAVEHVRGRLPIDDAKPIAAPTDDLRRVELCAMSGLPAGQACPTRRAEWVPDAATHGTCDWHHASDTGVITIWPPAFQAWARDRGLLDARPPVGVPITPEVRLASTALPHATNVGGAAAEATRRAERLPLAIVRPLGGALFLIDPTLRPEFQTLTLSASGGAPGPLEWKVNGAVVGVDEGTARVRWPLVRGRHDITVHDSAGQSARTYVEVR